MSSAKWRPFCLGLNVLTIQQNCKWLCGILVKPGATKSEYRRVAFHLSSIQMPRRYYVEAISAVATLVFDKKSIV